MRTGPRSAEVPAVDLAALTAANAHERALAAPASVAEEVVREQFGFSEIDYERERPLACAPGHPAARTPTTCTARLTSTWQTPTPRHRLPRPAASPKPSTSPKPTSSPSRSSTSLPSCATAAGRPPSDVSG